MITDNKKNAKTLRKETSIIYDEGYNQCKKDVLGLINEWWYDDKTCSGKPHCDVEDCDLCVTCLEELKKRIDG